MKWTESELCLLREIYPDVPTTDIAALLGRKVGPIHQAAARYGIKKSAAFFASDLSARILRGHKQEAMKASQFKKGHKTWNAGMKGWSAPGADRTQFKKGQMSGAAASNYVPIGSLRITKDGNLQRKMTDDPALYPARRWTSVARIVWEAANGPMPDGALIVFRPGCKTTDPELITADKLECITRAQNALRNSPYSKSPELGRLYQLKGAITRQVNRITKEHNEKSTHQSTARQTACNA